MSLKEDFLSEIQDILSKYENKLIGKPYPLFLVDFVEDIEQAVENPNYTLSFVSLNLHKLENLLEVIQDGKSKDLLMSLREEIAEAYERFRYCDLKEELR